MRKCFFVVPVVGVEPTRYRCYRRKLFPTEETNSQSGAERANADHDTNR